MRPLVSVVIPVYNGENYMREAIDCVIAQTYEHIEILVVNDGSTDSTEEIALSYGAKIRYFSKENGGVSTALNLGIANMSGEYFSWLSHDDLYTPDKIEKNIAALDLSAPTRIVYSDYYSIDEKGKPCGTTVSAGKLHRSADCELGLFPVIKGLIHGCSLLIHRSHFERVGVFDESLRATQDYELWFKMFRNQRLIYIPEPLVMGRIHPTQTGFISDKTIPEGEALWTNMLKNLTDDEMRSLDGSVRHFWINQAQFMKTATPYLKSTEYADMRLKECTDALRDTLVSVIVPFYNRIDLLSQSIKSIKQQTYSNWELLLIDDGSTEDISEIRNSVASDSRIKLITADHVGASHARNLGIDAASGKFIAFLDSDDMWAPQKLEKQLSFMLDNYCCVSHTNYSRVDFDGKFLAKMDLSDLSGDIFSACLYSCRVATPCVIIECEFLGDLRFPYDVEYGEDLCTWLELAWRGKWGLLRDPLTSVRVGKTSAYKDSYKQQLGTAEVLRYALKNPKWAVYQAELRIAAQGFASLFSASSALTNNPGSKGSLVAGRDVFGRLYRALRRHGAIGVLKIFLRRIRVS